MEIYNYPYGVKFKELSNPDFVDFFYGKNIAKLTLLRSETFRLKDPTQYQVDFTFKRTDITAIFNAGIPVAVPGTDQDFYDLLCSYLYQPVQVFLNPTPAQIILNIAGAAYAPVALDNGKYFIFDPPAAAKTFTITAGLPVGWYCYVVKGYAGGSVTINGAGGMAIVGIDTILNNQWAVAKITVIAGLQALVENIGG